MPFDGGTSGTFSRSASLVFVLSRDRSSARQAGAGRRTCRGRGQAWACEGTALHVIVGRLHRFRHTLQLPVLLFARALSEAITGGQHQQNGRFHPVL